LNNDRGGEYEVMNNFCKENGIRYLSTMPYKPQQNGIAEIINRTLMEMTRSMMAYVDLPVNFLGVALSTTAYILNRIKTNQNHSHPMNIGHASNYILTISRYGDVRHMF
jgi:hypothetical protein